ncbi:MAG TPA: hypothetical protein VK789_29695 [Bryobacteraceae bacterium]|nr:hypothetical protein [Bryobacteraceae bacterium]
MTPPYARIEYERRFLVDPASGWRRTVKPYSKLFKDRYLSCGRLRLRAVIDSDYGAVKYKLTKKYESDAACQSPMVSIYLSRDEYEALAQLDGHDLIKTRHYAERGGWVFSVNVFQDELDGLIICETEAASLEELAAVQFPPWASWEVTATLFFTGGILCQANRRQLLENIRICANGSG